ncbi:MAG TPA: amino acid adenylation domain-containing protein [Thermoanaerobaculia bacterium]|nr:amino acid adenylation domain-containing protein [Thermoanaerobaculia bacterium]
MSRQNVEDIYPLSPAQQGMLLYLLLTGSRSEVYFDQYVATLGATDPAALRRAWQRVVARHAALRTLFVWEKREQPLQVVRREVELPWQEMDWRGLEPSARQDALDAFLREDNALGFDPGKAPLTRVALIRWSDDEWKLVWSFSHLVLDGWSMALVLGDLQTLYVAEREGRDPGLPAPRPFREYISWFKRQDPAQAEERWRRTLAGFEPPTPLPFDGTGAPRDPQSPKAPKDAGLAAKEIERLLPAGAVPRLQALARSHQITVNTVFQGLWGVLLGRWGHVEDVVYGGIVSGRPHEVDGVEEMVGLFINALPVRLGARLDAGLIPMLRGLQAEQFEQRELEHCTLEQIQVWAGMPRQVPLFESILVFENYPLDPLGRSAGGGMALQVRDAHLAEAGNYPLTLYVAPRGAGKDRMALKLCYHWERFDEAAAQRILDGLEALLEGVLERPESRLGDLPLLTAAQTRELVAGAADAAGSPGGSPTVPVHVLFERQAARTPDAVAVAWSGGRVTYGELARAAGRLAGRLRSLGAGPEALVALRAERSPEMIAAMLAVLGAGAAYLPLDPAWPAERLAFMMADSGAGILLTQECLVHDLPAVEAKIELLDGLFAESGPAEPPIAGGPADPAHLAYVIYTSGSTGRPKGVLVGHSSLAHYVRSSAAAFGIGPDDRVLQFASVSFDTSAEEIYPCLTRGATLVLRDDAMVASHGAFASAIGGFGVTVLDLPTAYWHELVAEMGSQALVLPASVRLVILGGEQVQRDRLEIWTRRAPERIRLLNTYGPTEATIVTTRYELGGGGFAGDVPIGRPIEGARAYVAGLGQELLPEGLDGELLIGGPGLARGYLGRPGLTAERFVPDPHSGEPGARLYRTGDLVRRLPGGDLQFRGRTDSQVKVRGYRIELGEIEAALRALPSVRDALAVAREERGGGRRLVAWIVPEEGSAPTVGELRSGLQERLPDFMVPSAFGFLEELPRTPGGKVDRRAVARMETGSSRPDLDGDYAAPRNLVEEVLAEIWSDLLGVERVGIYDDFFQLGGHSLLVAKLASRVRQALRVELPMVEVFKQPTIAALGEAVERAERAGEVPELPPVRRAPRDRPIPLSFPQERVWLLDQLSPGGNIAYNFQVTIWFRGPLDVDALRRTLEEIVRRHEVLRTSFPTVEGRPVQVIHPPAPLDLPVVDLRGLPAGELHEISERLLAETTSTPFDVSRAPLVRWRLLRLEDDLYELIQVEHHFVHDGWSFGVMLREIKSIYTAFAAGEPSPLPEPPIQYADFAVWQREWMEGPVMGHLLDYWRGRLAGSPGVLELPTDRPRPARQTFRGDLELSPIPAELYQGLRTFSRKEGFTLYMTMAAAFLSLLHRYTGQDDILLGSSNANRRSRELEGMIGMVVNSLVLRGDLSGDPTFRELLERVRQVTLEAYGHQDMPFERLVQELRPERQLGRNPLFQVMFNFHDAAVPDLDFGGIQARFLVRGNRSSKMDLNVIVIPRAEQRVGEAASDVDQRALLHWEYSTELFDLSTMRRMIGHYRSLMNGILENPARRLSELPLLDEAETAQLLQEWSRTGPAPAADGTGETLHELFEARVRRDPEALALIDGRTRLSYGELNRRANRLAHTLRDLGVGPEVLVAVFLERSADLIAALLAVLKAGGAYVPLDPAYPRERIGLMLEDSGAPVVISRSSLEARLPEHGARVLRVDGAVNAREDEPRSLVESGNLAYQLYTSGSTGRPKAVALEHRGAVAFARWARGEFSPSELAGMLASTSVCFDLSVFEIFVPLAWGGTVVLAGNALELPNLPAFGEVTLVNTVPSAMAELLRMRAVPASVRTVNLAGEALRNDLVQEIYASTSADRVLNLYGPSEDTTYSTYARAPRGAEAEPSIGRPLPGTQAYLMDRRLQLVPRGVPGELLLGGVGLARGYFRRPELTAERFIPDPWSGAPGGRLYRTGDLARFRPDGEIEYLGRIDHQVKLRGFRIELGEIEVALGRIPGVQDAVVTLREERGDRRLVAYVAGTDPSVQELREALAQRLPAFMVPNDFVVLERLPLTPSGKVDRRALPSPGPVRPEAEAVYVAPRNPVEEALAGIWTEVLGVEPVSVCDDFFALGGHSLSAARVLSRVRDLLRVEVALPVVFERRTIERMADLISTLEPSAPAVDLLAGRSEGLDLVAQAANLSDADLDSLLEQMMEGGNS